ncbi:hypothetical protein [Edaphobacter modestus]|uniref:Uncharacterized protein n=1 Tax=Edaphobacter modestus TaxID=388466 RepID=A0A4Q7Z0A8_9BACT|nr:hypothetical protein [Edaphobacter modestus]RZU43580.1 hypothetical protein BDD14_5255 [Edaphobacter modestus]
MECVNTIEELVEAERAHLVLELSDVTLADDDAAAFLAACESTVSNSGTPRLSLWVRLQRTGQPYAVSLPTPVPIEYSITD